MLFFRSGSSSSPSPSVTKTTVANATLYDIYVVCEGDRHPDQQPKYTAEIYGMVFGYTTEGPPVKHEQGLVRIPSGTHHDFHSNCANMFYITIYYLDDDYNCKYFYKGFTVPRDTNLILSHSGHLLLADTKSTLIDKNKRDHQCYADKVLQFKEEVEKLRQKEI